MAGYKADRVSEDIKRAVITVIRELKDPRIAGKMLTIVRVDVSGDLSYAKVYVSELEGLETDKQAVKALKNAEGYIKNHVSKALHLRKTPELNFVADNSIEIGMHIDRILKENKPLDEEQ